MSHIHEAIDFTVVAYIVHDQRVLMINHRQLKKWLPPGGHIELDENPDQALFREINEETGIDRRHLRVLGHKLQLKSLDTEFLLTPSFLDIHKISDTHRHIGMIYILSSSTDKVVLAENEHTDIKWLTKTQLRETQYNLSPAIEFYATQALIQVNLIK